MKKVVLFAFILTVCGVLHNSVLAQEKPRYLVTYTKSQTTAGPIRSSTVVTVVNQSTRNCDVRVDWFDRDVGVTPTPECTDKVTVAPGDSWTFCSRALPQSITTCSLMCDPRLISHQGKAIVSSTESFNECSFIGVEARVYYTTGAGDTAISAISNSKIVFAGEGNLGD